jgi:ferric iron reductase protein FhuF
MCNPALLYLITDSFCMTNSTENITPASDETNPDDAFYVESEDIKKMAEENRQALNNFLKETSNQT